jgi:DNA-binding transcriptional LysR family regulator
VVTEAATPEPARLAAAATDLPLTLEHAWQLAEQANPALKNAQANLVAVEGQLADTQGLLWNNPQIAAERMREPAGVLRVTTASSFADAQLTSALLDFQAQYEQVEIVLSVGDKPTDLVAERVDLAVRITNTLDPAMIARPLARCRSMLCASPDYLQRHGLPRTADDLRQHRCIAHAFGIGKQYRLTRNDGETITVPVDWRFHTNETAILRRAALSGAGIGMLPTYYLGDDLSSGRLVHLLPDHEPEVLGIHAIYLSRQHQPLALRLLVDFLAERFGGAIAPWDALPAG